MISGDKKTDILFTFLVSSTLAFLGYKQHLLTSEAIDLNKRTANLEKSSLTLAKADSKPKKNDLLFSVGTYCGFGPMGRIKAKFDNKLKTLDARIFPFCGKKGKVIEVSTNFWLEKEQVFFKASAGNSLTEVILIKDFSFDTKGFISSYYVDGERFSQGFCSSDKFTCK